MLFTQAYNYFDKQKTKYEKYENITDHVFITDASNITDLNPMKFTLESNNKLVLSGNCSIVGVFNNVLSMWQWGWSIPFDKKAENYASRRILNYAFDIDTETEESIEKKNVITIFKTELLNSKLYLECPSIDIERYLAIALYLMRGEYYYKRTVENYNINTKKKEIVGEIYYLLSNIVIHDTN